MFQQNFITETYNHYCNMKELLYLKMFVSLLQAVDTISDFIQYTTGFEDFQLLELVLIYKKMQTTLIVITSLLRLTKF